MIFNDLVFFVCFLFPCVALYYAVGSRLKPLVIALFGVSFFLYFGALYCGMNWTLLALGILIWECLTSRLYVKGSRWCLFGIAQALLILIFFKYLVFFARIWGDLPALPKIVLPLGMSFFTFEFIHHAADCYFGKAQKGRFSVYLAFIFFFPTLASGPIKRFQQFAKDLAEQRFDPRGISQAITRIAFGLAKKHVLADSFNLYAQHLNTNAIYSASGPLLCAWVLAYGWRLYFDFSAYSDVAIGCAKLFGIEVPENFYFPYLSRNITEFWRRWHVSLMAWLQSYVFIPIYFSKWKIFGPKTLAGYYRLSITILLVFLLSGLWHGGAFHFLVWGAYHGTLVVSHVNAKNFMNRKGWRLPASLSTGITYACVNAGYVLFALGVDDALFVYKRILGFL